MIFKTDLLFREFIVLIEIMCNGFILFDYEYRNDDE